MRSAPRRFSGPSRTNRVMRVGRRRGMLRRVPLLSHVRLGVDTMGMVAPVYYTADMVRALPDDGNRYEVVHGELLVTPAPRLWHQKLVGRLYSALESYLRDQPVGEAFTAPADISWGRHVLVQPDVFVVPRAEARSLDWTAIRDRKSTRLNSSHTVISYAVFCLKKKKARIRSKRPNNEI